MKIKRGRKKRSRGGRPWSTISINHLESSALTLAGTLKASRVSARTASFLKEARERERVLTGGEKGGDESYEGYVFDVQKVIMGWFPVIISRAH